MKKIIICFAVFTLGILLIGGTFSLKAQTNGTLSFSVLSASTGNFSPKHCIAIWIEKSDGTFIKTRLKRAQTRVQYLNVWRSKSGDDVTDATTGATINTHQTESITWNCTDVSGAQVPDGDYKVWMQIAWANSNGPTYSVPFTKGPAAQQQTPADQTNFKSMMLDWIPSFVNVHDINGSPSVEMSPNPASSLLNIRFNGITSEHVIMKVFNISGQLVIDGNLDVVPSMVLPLNIAGLPNGTYSINIESEGVIYNKKIVISR